MKSVPRKTIAAVVVLALVVAGGYAVARQLDDKQTGCAEMADSIGLYPGNNVTLLGVKIGTISDIKPEKGHVRIDFDVNDGVEFPSDVSAVTTSESIVTDRRLEISESYTGGPRWDLSRCIPLDRTHTPKSISAAYASFDKLAHEITTASVQSPQQAKVVRTAMTTLDDSLTGSSGDFNSAVKGLAEALGDPALRDTQLRSLLTNAESLTDFFVERWPDIASGLDHLGEFAVTFDEWFSVLNPTVVDVTALTPSLLRLIRTYSPMVFGILDKVVPLTDDIPVDTIVGALQKLPPVSAGLKRLVAADSGPLPVKVAPPRFAVPATSNSRTCAAVNRALPRSCKPDPAAGGIDLRLVELVLGSVAPR